MGQFSIRRRFVDVTSLLALRRDLCDNVVRMCQPMIEVTHRFHDVFAVAISLHTANTLKPAYQEPIRSLRSLESTRLHRHHGEAYQEPVSSLRSLENPTRASPAAPKAQRSRLVSSKEQD